MTNSGSALSRRSLLLSSLPLLILGVTTTTAPGAEEKIDPTVERFRNSLAKPDVDREKLRQEALAFWRAKVGTPAAVQAAAVINQLPSPLDHIDPKTIGELERFDWQPKELVAVLGEHRGRHGAGVTCLVYTRDNKRVISGGAQGYVRLWDSTTLRQQARLGTGSATTCLAVSRDSKTLAAGNAGGGVYVWDISRKAPVQTGYFPVGTSAVYSVDISADGKLLAAGVFDGLIHTWDLDGSKPKVRTQLSGHKAAVRAVAFAPDSKYLAGGAADGTIRFWSFLGEKINELGSLPVHTGAISCMIYNPRGALLTVGCDDGHLVRVTIGAKFVKGITFKTPAAVTSIGYSPGHILTTSHSDGAVRVWGGGGTPPKTSITVEGHFGSVTGFGWSSDGRMLATGGVDWTVRQWTMSAVKGTERFLLRGHWMGSNNNPFAPDGGHLATASNDRTARVWDGSRTTPIQMAQFPPTPTLYKGDAYGLAALAFTPDSKMLATGGSSATVKLWDVGRRTTVRSFAAPTSVGTLLFTPEGNSLIAISGPTTIVSWTTANARELMRVTTADRYQNGLALSPEGRHALVGTGYYVLDAKGRPTMKDGKYVYQDISMRLFDLRRGKLVKDRTDLPVPVGPTSYHPDGRAICTLWGQASALWDVTPEKLKETLPLKGFLPWGHPSVFSPDARVVNSSGSNALLLIDFDNEKILKTWSFEETVYSYSFSPDGRYLAVSLVTGPVYLLRVQEPPAPVSSK